MHSLAALALSRGSCHSGGVHSAAGSVLVRGRGNRMNRRALVSVVLGCLLVPILAGCTRTVQGRVVGRTSSEPMVGALVTISGESTRTDAAGAFLLTGIGGETAKGAVVASGFPETSFDVDLSKGDASSTVQVTDAVVSVSLKERAVEPAEITSATITLGGRPVVTGQPLKNLAPGKYTLAVAAANHEPYSAEVALAPGENSLVATISLTPLATYKRFYAAGQFHRDSTAYKYVHPDERKKLSLKAWKKWSSGTEDLSIKWGGVRVLAKWKSPVTKKTYQNVAEIDRTNKWQVTGRQYSDFGKIYTDNFSQHWANLNGIWYILHKAIP